MMPTFERIGDCNRFCGRCCSIQHWRTHYPEVAATTLAQPPFAGEDAFGDCVHLQWTQGRAECAIYDTRPEICRVFPNHPDSLVTLPSCTFRFTTTCKG